jgi:hypothetical protein
MRPNSSWAASSRAIGKTPLPAAEGQALAQIQEALTLFRGGTASLIASGLSKTANNRAQPMVNLFLNGQDCGQ